MIAPETDQQHTAWRIRHETAEHYPRILAERGQSYAAGWLAARTHIATQLEASR